MKKITLLAIFIGLYGTSGQAQNSDFPLDDTGKITFQGVAEIPGLSREALYRNALDFLSEVKVANQKKKENYLVEEEGKLSTLGGFLVYNYKSPDGEIRYDLSIEVKDNKYRYTITDFVFYPYSRNRYGQFERDKWKSKSLDELAGKSEQKSWDNHRTKTAQKMEQLISKMAAGMESLPIMAEEPKQSKEANW